MTGRSVGRRSDRNGTCSFRVLPPSSSSPASSFFHCGSSAQLSSAQHSGDRQRDGSILRVGIVVSGTANYFVRAILGRRGDGETVFCHAYCLYALSLSPSCLSFSFSFILSCSAPPSLLTGCHALPLAVYGIVRTLAKRPEYRHRMPPSLPPSLSLPSPGPGSVPWAVVVAGWLAGWLPVVLCSIARLMMPESAADVRPSASAS